MTLIGYEEAHTLDWVRIPEDLGTWSEPIWAPVPTHVGAIGAKLVVGGLGRLGQVALEPLLLAHRWTLQRHRVSVVHVPEGVSPLELPSVRAGEYVVEVRQALEASTPLVLSIESVEG